VCCSKLDDAAAVNMLTLLLPRYSNFADNNYELGNQMLAHAVCEGKLQVAQALYAAGADVNHTHCNGTTMHHAAASGNLAVVQWLQSLGLSARALSDQVQALPLHYACQYQQVHMAKYLLALPDATDDVHARCNTGQVPLHYEAEHKADSVVELRIQLGADVNARDFDGCTPLMEAGSLAVVKLLLAAGADATAADLLGITVLQYQARRGACAGTACLLLNAGADPIVVSVIEDNSVTLARIGGMGGHFALEALLSRAADDYRKKNSTPSTVKVTAISSTSSSSSSSTWGSSVGAKPIATSTTTSSSSSSTGTYTDGLCAESSVASDFTAKVTTASDGKATGPSTTTNTFVAAVASALATAVAAVSQEEQQQQQSQQQQQQCKQRKAKQPCANCSKPTTYYADAVQLCTTAE
jgi:uncharacterized protein